MADDSPNTAKLLNDDELVDLFIRASAGEEGAWTKLVDLTANYMWHVAQSILWHDDDTEECLQDAWENIIQAKESFDRQRGRFLTWAGTIVRNQAINIARKRSRERARTIEFDPAAHGEATDNREIWYTSNGRAVDLPMIVAALPKLTDAQQSVLIRVYIGCETREAIAASLGTNLEGLRSTLNSAMRALRRVLGVNGKEDMAEQHQQTRRAVSR